ncbi:MAG TPA: hypothetical protein VEI98_02405 [Xanthobacteraceae bacterium]|nr:hypothetical protein [Xanthobacteraceae bacterium]
MTKAVRHISLSGVPGRSQRAAFAALLAATAAAGIAASLIVSTASFALPRYDGLWSVSVVTEKGDCDPGYRYPVRITNGTLSNAGDANFTVSGRVGNTGAITVTVSAAGKSATGSGRLAGDAGMGSWTGGACSGRWTAERRGS